MRTIGYCFYFLVVLFGLSGCRQQKGNEEAGKEEEIALGVMKVAGSGGGDRDYRVRIFPSKDMLEGRQDIQTAMWYDADSCFFLLAGSEKIYPNLQEPVANGTKNSFEYLLLFPEVPGIPEKSLKLVYSDRHFNRKTYVLNLHKD
ncbi:hypothetical protein [Pedobacter sp. SYSU D00535]|uniref:hypothetical protein n=1 Tax=Pedobacter sp. SYSU D00535 TaxID=2810308 RepID=UPI001A976DA7|nr:hypothetical protein [Pedobacter sp. SYSU D00535]